MSLQTSQGKKNKNSELQLLLQVQFLLLHTLWPQSFKEVLFVETHQIARDFKTPYPQNHTDTSNHTQV